jgi:hypothetical protein
MPQRKLTWGQWHEGNALDVRVSHGPEADTYPDDFSCQVQVRDRATQKVSTHRARGSFIGNFSPIWIRYKGKRVQITELLRYERTGISDGQTV